jgi:hypothetical protein
MPALQAAAQHLAGPLAHRVDPVLGFLEPVLNDDLLLGGGLWRM